MTDYRVGYVGLDHLHRDPYFQVIDALPVELTCACEPNPAFDIDRIAPMADRPDAVSSEDVDVGRMLADVPVYRDPAALLDDEDVDVLWLSMPSRDTPAVIEAAVERGVHVVSEKPMARTAAELEPAAEAARASDVSVGVTYFYRAHPIAAELHDLVADGFFGDLLTVDARYLGSTLARRDTSHFLYDAEASRGGALQWLGVHWVDLLLWILDDPIERVNARAAYRTDGVDVEDAVSLQFETRGGAIGTYDTGYVLGGTEKEERFDVYGTDGRAVTTVGRGDDPVPLDLHSYRDEWQGAPRRTIDYALAYDRLPSWGDLVLEFFTQFFDGLSGDRAVPADIDDAVRVLRVLDAAYESADSGQWVETGL